MCVVVFFVLLTLPFNFIRAPGPDNGPGLQLDQESPSLGPLALLGVEQGQHGAQLQVPVQAVGLHRVAALHPRHRRAVGEEARRPGHDVLCAATSPVCYPLFPPPFSSLLDNRDLREKK